MKIGTDQYNTFDTMTMDCWNDRVYYEGRSFRQDSLQRRF